MTQLFTKLINLIEYISKHFYHLLNGIINSTNYKSYLASLFILIFVVLILLVEFY